MKLAILLFLFTCSAFAASQDVRVIDGDTVNVPMSLVAGMPNRVSVRLLGVNTPEMHGKCAAEKQKAQVAKAFVQGKFDKAQSVKIEYVHWDKYARVDGKVTLDGNDLAADLIKAGLGVAYSGGKRDPLMWCK